MVQILAIQAHPPSNDEAQISAVRWYNPDSGQINVATTDVMIKFLAEQNGKAYVFNGKTYIDVVAQGTQLTTQPRLNENGTPHLMALPRF